LIQESLFPPDRDDYRDDESFTSECRKATLPFLWCESVMVKDVSDKRRQKTC